MSARPITFLAFLAILLGSACSASDNITGEGGDGVDIRAGTIGAGTTADSTGSDTTATDTPGGEAPGTGTSGADSTRADTTGAGTTGTGATGADTTRADTTGGDTTGGTPPAGGGSTGGGSGADSTLSPTKVATGWVAKTLIDNGVTYKYQVFVPPSYNSANSPLPIILFMHGTGEDGTDGVKQTTEGLGPYIKARESTFPMIAVFPQTLAGEGTAALRMRISELTLNRTIAEYAKADTNRIYLTGLSSGGFWAFQLALAKPARYAAFAPMSILMCTTCFPGQTLTKQQAWTQGAQILMKLPIWQFHGDADPMVPVTEVRAQIAAFKAAGHPIIYTEYPGVGHSAWQPAYNDPNLWTWMLSKRRQ
jgi:predicted esterase